MSLFDIACDCVDNFLFSIENYIDNESEFCLFTRPKHIFVHWVTVENSCS